MAVNMREATAEQVREWARSNGYQVGDRGRFATDVVREFNRAHKRNRLQYGGGTTTTSAPAPAKSTARPASNSAPARRAPRTASTTAPAPRQDAESRVVALGSTTEVEAMVADAIAALQSAANVGGKKGEPVLVTVTAQRLAYA